MTLRLIAPDLAGPLSGGTLYNAYLLQALRARGIACEHLVLDPARTVGLAGLILVDSLYLDALPALCASSPRAHVYLLVHYLPALVEHGREVEPAELSEAEREALRHARGFVATSDFMARALSKLSAKSVVRVEPGVPRLPEPSMREDRTRPRAVMLCNVVPAKGVLELLRALAAQTRPQDDFELWIAGRLDMDPGYAANCAELVASGALLRDRVRLLGALDHSDALALVTGADVLLSASRMEAYGMALAEARAVGVPILARRGGHAEAHVRAEAGGELLADEATLAATWLALARQPHRLRERRRLALRARRARSWREAADELIAGLEAAEGLPPGSLALR